MELKDYKITSFKAGTFKDDYQNTWCDMSLEGFGEPVRITVKDPAKFSVGMMIHGRIEEKTSKAGKPYYKFTRVMKPQEGDSYAGGNKYQDNNYQKKEWTPRDDSHIRAQWSINAALQLFAADPTEFDTTEKLHAWFETTAKTFYAMVDRVKNSGVTETVTGSGMSEEELASLAESGMDEPLDMSGIPF